MFGRTAQRAFKLARNFSQKKSVRRVAAGGAGTSFCFSLFSSGQKQPTETQSKETAQKIKNYDIVLRDTDELYDNYLIDNAYNILKKFGSSDNSELLWRLARVLCEKSKLSKDVAEKKQYMLEAFAVVQKALVHEPESGCFGAHKWYAIILDYVGELQGSKSRIEKSHEVKEHLEKALKIYYDDPTTWHILGLWHFAFADMGYATRLVAKTIFATPPSSTYDQALHYFMRAEEISPGFYSTNTFYIAEVYDRLGKKEDAVEYYKKAFKMSVLTADDAAIHKKAHDNLRRNGVKDSELVA
ncbi:unnamed protein product [Caenorhabditis auriculariae]|uniref:Regulator of microtubule dynamics protein 1 n=1 Tax=Caenorhabditis auriculariae TaxID=2777116 RepID=A0A8S1H6L0_9PELO|nr:unnamed protein product [Caenorhabditis auriculariae]